MSDVWKLEHRACKKTHRTLFTINMAAVKQNIKK